MKKQNSYVCINTLYRWEYLKESFNAFLNGLMFEIKNKGINVQITCTEKDDTLLIKSNNDKVIIECGVKNPNYVNAEFRYDEANPKVCTRVILTFCKGN